MTTRGDFAMPKLTPFQRHVLDILRQHHSGLSIHALATLLEAEGIQKHTLDLWGELHQLTRYHQVQCVPLPKSTPEAPRVVYRLQPRAQKPSLPAQEAKPRPSTHYKAVPEASSLSATLLDRGVHYEFTSFPLEDHAFFTFRIEGNTLKIVLNEAHPVYEKLAGLFHNDEESAQVDAIAMHEAVRWLLIAWAEYESSRPTTSAQQRAGDIRAEWGRTLEQLLRG